MRDWCNYFFKFFKFALKEREFYIYYKFYISYKMQQCRGLGKWGGSLKLRWSQNIIPYLFYRAFFFLFFFEYVHCMIFQSSEKGLCVSVLQWLLRPPLPPGSMNTGGSLSGYCKLADLTTEFLSLGTIDILGCIILCCEVCSVHCRIISRIPRLYALDAIIIPTTVVTTENVSRHCQISLRDKTLLCENHSSI